MSRYLLVADPLESFTPERDSGVVIAKELISQGIAIDYLNANDIRVTKIDSEISKKILENLPVQRILSSNAQAKPFFNLDNKRLAHVDEYTVILQRKDPPVDEQYQQICNIFSYAPRNILQINNPEFTWQKSEKAIPMDFPEHSIPTQTCESLENLIQITRNAKTELVFKPSNFFAGIGIGFFMPNAPEEEIKKYWDTHKPKIFIQPAQEAIKTLGDLRILTFEGEVLGCLRRIPKEGSRLANLLAGATGHFAEPTEKQMRAVKAVSKELSKQGLHLLGFDFIGDLISEVNFTCPTGIPGINRVGNKTAEVPLIAAMEKLSKNYSRRQAHSQMPQVF